MMMMDANYDDCCDVNYDDCCDVNDDVSCSTTQSTLLLYTALCASDIFHEETKQCHNVTMTDGRMGELMDKIHTDRWMDEWLRERQGGRRGGGWGGGKNAHNIFPSH